jgi:hypothetical protein
VVDVPGRTEDSPACKAPESAPITPFPILVSNVFNKFGASAFRSMFVICEKWITVRGWRQFAEALSALRPVSFTLFLAGSFVIGHFIQELADWGVKRIKGPRFFKIRRDDVWGARVGEISESERDWNYARRQLAGGVDPERVIQSIAHFRHDKDNPEYYSRQTVTRAYASVALGRGDRAAEVQQRVAELSTHQWNPESYARHTVSEIQGKTAQRNIRTRVR